MPFKPAKDFLQTKLNIPRARPKLVVRARLTERLKAGQWRPVTIVTAPAGYGKTTLVSQWLQGSGRKVAWVSLDERDNDPVRFFNYLIAGLQKLTGTIELPTDFPSPHAPEKTEEFLISLVNALNQVSDEFVLVLDDFHFIQAPRTLESVRFLLENLPAKIFVVFTGRDHFPLPLSRLRARDHLNELTVRDLGFNIQEAKVFLNEIMNLELSDHLVATLTQRTEGWIAGLQLAALSLQGCGNVKPLLSQTSDGFQYVTDYLVDEVLRRQSPQIQDFLLQTSILARFCDSLCSVVTGQTNTHEILAKIQGANLFVFSLDGEDRWFRYHHVFRDLLAQHLQNTMPTSVVPLHIKASSWYKKNGFFIDAIDHLVAAKEYTQAAKLIEDYAESLCSRHEIGVLEKWFKAIPAEIVNARLPLLLIQAGVFLLVGDIQALKGHVMRINAALGKSPPRVPRKEAQLRGELASLEGHLAELEGDLDLAVTSFREALAQLPDKNSRLYRGIEVKLHCLTTVSDNGAGNEVPQFKSPPSKDSDFDFTLAALASAVSATCQGRFRAAVKAYNRILKWSDAKSTPAQFRAVALAHLAMISYQRNELDEAWRFAEECLEIAKRARDWSALFSGCMTLVDLNRAKADYEGAQKLLSEMLVQHRDIPLLRSTIMAWQAEVWISQKQFRKADAWQRQADLDLDKGITIHRERAFLAAARLRLAKQQPAGDFLQMLEASARRGGRNPVLIEILTLKALSLQHCDDHDDAAKALSEAIATAAPERIFRIFVDEGQPVYELLSRLPSERGTARFANELLGIFVSSQRLKTSATPNVLSKRELEVLRHVSAGMSNGQIAEALFLSTGTVKRHVHNILNKLGVVSRTQASARAAALELI